MVIVPELSGNRRLSGRLVCVGPNTRPGDPYLLDWAKRHLYTFDNCAFSNAEKFGININDFLTRKSRLA